MAGNKKLKKNNLADQVCEAIRTSIKAKEWEEGTKLPSEANLAEMYGVNRLTIRIALQKLNAMGILETRAGEGTFVRAFDFIKYINDVSDMIMSPDMLEDVWEFRRYFELECIRLSILHAGEAEIENIEEKYRAFEEVVNNREGAEDERIRKIIETDLELHYEICKSTKNSLFPLAFAAVREPLYQYIKSLVKVRMKEAASNDPHLKAMNDESLANHRSIISGIKNRDYEFCEKIYLDMTDHKKK